MGAVRRSSPFWREESASALPVALALIVVLTTLVGTVMMVGAMQHRFIRRDAHGLQARYDAEGGVYAAMARLREDPEWRPTDAPLDLPGGGRAYVTVETFGGYLAVRSIAEHRRGRAAVRALVGELPPGPFDYALVLWDSESSVNVAGGTVLTGDVLVGERGLKESTFKGRPFTGRVRGTVREEPSLESPFVGSGVFLEALAQYDKYLITPPVSGSAATADTPSRVERLPSDNRVVYLPDGRNLSSSDSALIGSPVTLVAGGDLTVQGPLRMMPGTVLIVGGRLTVSGPVDGRSIVLYGAGGVSLSGGASLSAQVFSKGHVALSKSVHLTYPSAIYAAGSAAAKIVLSDAAVVEGTVVYPVMPSESTAPEGRVVVGDSARVRGAVFNAGETELHGAIYGSLLTRQLYFYESPSSYVNWLKDAEVDVTARPEDFLLPVAFSPHPRLGVLSWEVSVGDASQVLEKVDRGKENP